MFPRNVSFNASLDFPAKECKVTSNSSVCVSRFCVDRVLGLRWVMAPFEFLCVFFSCSNRARDLTPRTRAAELEHVY